MKKLTKILLINWLYFSMQVIELDDINFLTGKNGSGKSTVIDALQIVLLGETNAKNFNKAANDHSQRTLDGYLRADMDGKNPNSRRGRDFTSYIACEFHDDINGSSFVAGVVFDCGSDGSRREQFFIYDGAMPDNHFVVHSLPMNISQLRQYIKDQSSIRGKLYDRQKEYRADLLAKWNVHKEQAFTMMKKAVSFQPIVDIQKFITENVCDVPDRPDIEAMQQNIRDYKHHENLAQRQEEKLNQLKEIDRCFTDWQTAESRHRLHRFLSVYAKQQDVRLQIDKQTNEMHDCENRIKQIQGEAAKLSEEKGEKQRRRDELMKDRVNSDVYQEKNRLETRLTQLRTESNGCSQRMESTALEIRRSVDIMLGQAKTILDFAGDEMLENLANRVADLQRDILPFSECTEEIFDADETLFSTAQQSSAAFSDTLRLTSYQVDNRIAGIKKDKDEREGILASLKRNIKDYPTGLLDLKRELSAQLSKQAGKTISVDILADVLEIAHGEETWRGAVEGYLNNQKFYMLVPVEWYDRAVSIYNAVKTRYAQQSFGLVDIGKLREKERDRLSPWDDSLAKKVETSNLLARDYIDFLLGRVVCVAHVGQLRRHKVAITADGMLYQGYVVRPIPKKRMDDAFIGQSAVALRMTAVQEELRKIEDELAEWQPVSQWLSYQKNRESIFSLRFIQSELPERKRDYKRIVEIKEQLISIEKAISGLDLLWLTKLDEQIRRVEAEIISIDEKNKRLAQEEGSVHEKWTNIRKNILPQLDEENDRLENAIEDEFSETYRTQTGLPRYEQELTRLKRAETVHRNFSGRCEQSKREEENARSSMIQKRADFVRAYQPCSYNVNALDNGEFRAEQARLEESELPKYREKIRAARESAIEQFQNDFLAKLKSSIDMVQSQVKNLNKILDRGQFGTERYRFIVERNPDYADYYDMIMSPDLMEDSGGLFAFAFHEKYGTMIDDLFNRIASANDTQFNTRKQSELQQNIERYTDFRTYLKFDLETTDQNGNSQLLSKTLNTKSGGETQTPFYIAVLASFAQLYQVHNKSKTLSNTVRLVVFDEAFNKMDSDRIIESINLLRRMGLQAIICTPPDKSADIAPLADRTLLVGKQDYSMHILPYIKEIADQWNEE